MLCVENSTLLWVWRKMNQTLYTFSNPVYLKNIYKKKTIFFYEERLVFISPYHLFFGVCKCVLDGKKQHQHNFYCYYYCLRNRRTMYLLVTSWWWVFFFCGINYNNWCNLHENFLSETWKLISWFFIIDLLSVQSYVICVFFLIRILL